MKKSNTYRRLGDRKTGNIMTRMLLVVGALALFLIVTLAASTYGMWLGGADVFGMPLIENGTLTLGDLLGI